MSNPPTTGRPSYFPIESHRLLVFYAVAETGSLTAAAQQLSLTRTALSHALKALEADLGCTLFDRQARSVMINAAGERLRPHAKAILEAMQLTRVRMGARCLMLGFLTSPATSFPT